MAAVSEEVITFAYNLFLERNPESKEAIEYHKEAKNIQELGQRLMNSNEFKSRMGIENNKVHLCDPIYVEDEISPEKINLMMILQLKEFWSNYGNDEPYWSVLTEEKYGKKYIHKHQEEFYKTGVGSQKKMMDALNRSGISIKKFSTCLEFGCGVGRVTVHLAKLFKSVIACDISTPHLKIAEEYAKRNGFDNILFQNTLSPNELLEFKNVDVVFSIIVLQHNPPPLITEYIKMFLSILNKGGVAFFQATTYLKGYKFSIDDYIKNIDEPKGVEMHILPQNKIFKIVKEKKCIVCEVREDNWPGDRNFISNSFLIQKL